MEAKLLIGAYFMEHVMPEAGARLARISAGADSLMAMPQEEF
jgi:hypothetical protein